jgi:hypothetical protein
MNARFESYPGSHCARRRLGRALNAIVSARDLKRQIYSHSIVPGGLLVTS